MSGAKVEDWIATPIHFTTRTYLVPSLYHGGGAGAFRPSSDFLSLLDVRREQLRRAQISADAFAMSRVTTKNAEEIVARFAAVIPGLRYQERTIIYRSLAPPTLEPGVLIHRPSDFEPDGAGKQYTGRPLEWNQAMHLNLVETVALRAFNMGGDLGAAIKSLVDAGWIDGLPVPKKAATEKNDPYRNMYDHSKRELGGNDLQRFLGLVDDRIGALARPRRSNKIEAAAGLVLFCASVRQGVRLDQEAEFIATAIQ